MDYFIKEVENISPCVAICYRNTCESLGEHKIAWKHLFQLQFLVIPNFHSCFYNCMETQKMFLLLQIT